MSSATAKLLSEFEALPAEDKQEFVRTLINHLPPWDSGPLSDDVVAAAGDALAQGLDGEERASQARRSLAVRLRHGRESAASSNSQYSLCRY